MKHLLIGFFVAVTYSVSAQSFVAGWDFDGVLQSQNSVFANWGVQDGSALMSWTHSPSNPPIVFTSEYGISPENNSAVINNSFSFLEGGVDSSTGFTAFSDNVSGGDYGFQSFTADDTLSLQFDGFGWEGLQLSYAFAASQGGVFNVETVDLGFLNGNSNAQFHFMPALDGVYDNFAITGTAAAVVPEPSTYAFFLACFSGLFVFFKRRK